MIAPHPESDRVRRHIQLPGQPLIHTDGNPQFGIIGIIGEKNDRFIFVTSWSITGELNGDGLRGRFPHAASCARRDLHAQKVGRSCGFHHVQGLAAGVADYQHLARSACCREAYLRWLDREFPRHGCGDLQQDFAEQRCRARLIELVAHNNLPTILPIRLRQGIHFQSELGNFARLQDTTGKYLAQATATGFHPSNVERTRSAGMSENERVAQRRAALDITFRCHGCLANQRWRRRIRRGQPQKAEERIHALWHSQHLPTTQPRSRRLKSPSYTGSAHSRLMICYPGSMKVVLCPNCTHDAALPQLDEVGVWSVPFDGTLCSLRLFALLTPDEQIRAERFRAVRAREEFVVTRGLLRRLLGECLAVKPQQVPIGYVGSGKPVLAESSLGLHFNVTHTQDLGLIALARQPVGIDVERVRVVSDPSGLVKRFFSSLEQEVYESLPLALRPSGFFRGWTCKEAVLKAVGMGVAHLDCFDVELDPTRPPAVLDTRDARLEATPWCLETWEPAPGYTAALAMAGM